MNESLTQTEVENLRKVIGEHGMKWGRVPSANSL
jgi:hypothetical protein